MKEQLSEMNPSTLVIIAAIIGFFVVSKLFDFFKKGSSWEENPAPPMDPSSDQPGLPPPASSPDASPEQNQKEQYKRFLEEEKRRRDGDG